MTKADRWLSTPKCLLEVGLLSIVLCAISPRPARATTIYTYTGNGLSSVICGTCGVSGSNFVSGTVSFATALAAGLVDANVAALVTSYSFTDGVQAADNTTTNLNFFVSTNASRQITAWDFEAWSFTTGVAEIQTTNGIFTCRPNGCSSGNGDSVSLANITVVAQNSRPGTWGGPVTTSPVPEPSSLLLLGTGVLTLVGFRRRLLGT